MMTQEQLRETFAIREANNDIAWELRDLAGAFLMTGNIEVFNKLEHLAGKLARNTDRMEQIISEGIAEEYREVWVRSATILDAALAGIKVAQDGDAGEPMV